MSMVKCKECGQEVSSKAKTCPNCGVKSPKHSSGAGWWILGIFIFIIIIATNQNPSSNISSTANNSSSSSHTASAPAVKPSWYSFDSTDEMSGEFSAYASSPLVSPTRRMDFPYSDVKSWMAVGCKRNGGEWVYFGFTEAPNLTNDKTKDGYNLINTRIKWDNTLTTTTLTQDWGDKFLSFRDDKSALPKIAASNTAKLELDWYGQGKVYFNYTLHGSSKALSEIRAKCRM